MVRDLAQRHDLDRLDAVLSATPVEVTADRQTPAQRLLRNQLGSCLRFLVHTVYLVDLYRSKDKLLTENRLFLAALLHNVDIVKQCQWLRRRRSYWTS